MDEVIKKARKRLYCLVQLKRSGLEPRELTQFFCPYIRPILENSCPVYHNSLPAFLSHDLEAIQKRAMRIIYSPCSYQEALVKAELPLLKDRRQELTSKLFKEILEKDDHRLHELLPELNNNSVNVTEESASSTLSITLIGLGTVSFYPML